MSRCSMARAAVRLGHAKQGSDGESDSAPEMKWPGNMGGDDVSGPSRAAEGSRARYCRCTVARRRRRPPGRQAAGGDLVGGYRGNGAAPREAGDACGGYGCASRPGGSHGAPTTRDSVHLLGTLSYRRHTNPWLLDGVMPSHVLTRCAVRSWRARVRICLPPRPG
jgi:hypothetical protein